MNKKLTKEDAVKRAAQDFKTLILYYNVTRPQQLPYFKRNDKFSIKEMKRQINFGGKSMDTVKKMNLDENQMKQFMACQAHYNYTFGIPRERINAVLRSYRDDNGHKIRISVQDVLPIVEADIGTIEHKSHGEAWGKYSFCGKWMMDDKIRDNYLKDKKWSNIYTAPNVSEHFRKLIDKWIEEDRRRNNQKHTEEKDMTTVDEEKEAFIQEAEQAEPIQEVEPLKKEQEESLDDLVRAWNNKTVEVKKEQPKTNEDKRAKYFDLKEKYLTGVIDFTEFRNWMVANGVNNSILKQWDDHEMNRLQEQVQEKSKPQVEVDIDELVKLVS